MTSINTPSLETRVPSFGIGGISIGFRMSCRIAAMSVAGLLAACGGGGGDGSTGTTTVTGTSTNTSSDTGSSSSSTSSSTTSSSSSSGSSSGTTSSGTCDITVTTADSYSKIEAANPGQTVCIAPGTYRFRVTLTKTGTATSPIVIRALDPNNRPVFDYQGSSYRVDHWPGSYSSSDAYRSAWRVTGSYYTIDGIIIQGANNRYENWANFDNTAGIRYLNSRNLTVRNSRLYDNDMGIQGGGSNTVIEYTEFDNNGNPYSDQSHNIYILGGDNFTLRYSYSHDCRGGQNFHIRARNATVAYNWFQNASDYEGDMMTNQTTYDPGNNGIQNMLFIGNVVVQNPNPGNGNKLMTFYNDTGAANIQMNLTAYWNTFVFTQAGVGTSAAAVQFSTATLTSGTVLFSNNVVMAPAARSVFTTDGGSGVFNKSGTNNFFPTGSAISSLVNTKFGADVLFTNAAGKDYSLQAASPATGWASTGVTPKPVSKFSAPPTAGGLLAGKFADRSVVTNPGAIQ